MGLTMVGTNSTQRPTSPRVKYVLGTVPSSKTPLTAEEQLAVLNAAVAELKKYIKYVDLCLTNEQRRELEELDDTITDRNTTLVADHSSQLGHRFYLDKHLAIHDAVLREDVHGQDHRTPIAQLIRCEPPYERLGELLVQDKYLLPALVFGISDIIDEKIRRLEDYIRSLRYAKDRVTTIHARVTHLL
jgi:hypothetical protein